MYKDWLFIFLLRCLYLNCFIIYVKCKERLKTEEYDVQKCHILKYSFVFVTDVCFVDNTFFLAYLCNNKFVMVRAPQGVINFGNTQL